MPVVVQREKVAEEKKKMVCEEERIVVVEEKKISYEEEEAIVTEKKISCEEEIVAVLEEAVREESRGKNLGKVEMSQCLVRGRPRDTLHGVNRDGIQVQEENRQQENQPIPRNEYRSRPVPAQHRR